MRGLSASTAWNETISGGQKRRARNDRRRWPYGWLAAPVVAALVVARASAVPLPTAGTAAQAAAVTGLLAGSAVLAVTPGVALLSVLARYRRLGPATALGLLYAGAGAAAMAGFWAWFARPALGVAFGAVLLAVCVVVIAVFGRRGDLGRFGLSLPLALALAVSVLYTGLAFLRGGPTAVAWKAVEHLFWAEPDDRIPLLFAARLAAHAPLGGYLLGDWRSSDRPPLETGFVLLQWPLWSTAGRQGCYEILGTVLQSAWLPALWVVFRVRGISAGRACAAVLATAATGVMYFNTLYVWPKMLAGALALAVAAILFSREPGDRWRGACVLAAALAVLSLLAHGGTSFALLALVPFLIPLWRKVTAWALVASAAAAVILYGPWMLYQRFVDPPGTRLLKWMLAGVVPIDGRGVLRSVIDQYRSLSFTQLLANKWVNVMTLVANMKEWHQTHSEATWTAGFPGYARIAGINFLVPATGLLLLGAFALLLPSARRKLADVRPLAAFTALALAMWVVLLWGARITTQVHQSPYAMLVLFIGLCALAVTALPLVLSGTILAASAAWFVIEWVPGITFRPAYPLMPASSPVDWSMAVVCGCALLAIIAIATAAYGAGASAIIDVPISRNPSRR